MIFPFLAVLAYAEEPMIVAHRGASRDAPENTIPAFELAWEQGADAIEGDFRLTRDGHIVCIHNKDTGEVAGRNLVVKDSTLDALRKLDVGAHHGEKYRGTVIPTIAEVFSTIPEQKKIYIEVKCGVEIIPALLEEINRAGITKEQILVISFKEKVIQELKARAPQYRASWLCSFKKQETGVMTPSLETVLNTLKLIQADGLSSNPAVPRPIIEEVARQGYEWHVWTVDDLKTARRTKALGVKSITTNIPAFMKKNLVEQSPAGDVLKAASEE